ncbi:MAG TPA: SpoIIE family protein phosphatase [Bacillota bacterium]|nr:SpoIIE family protein phosphatase [Bacillota bacterium]
MNKIHVDVEDRQLTKDGEELCGDKVEVVRDAHSVTVVLADGLGSGVKANILSTLTAKIAATMRANGAPIDEVISTIIQTLPTCKVRQLAYSTLSLLEIDEDGSAYLVEFDNPPTIFLNHRGVELERIPREIAGKTVRESQFTVEPGDFIALISDGVVHAGVGSVLNLGWQWEHVVEYLERKIKETHAIRVVHDLVEVCETLYQSHPGDDATVIGIGIRHPVPVCLFTGPPKDPADDPKVCEKLMSFEGKKVISGGTATNIISKLTGKKAKMESYENEDVPPAAIMEGIDLVTEGIITLSKTVDLMREAINRGLVVDGKDGAQRLARLLLEDCTELKVLLGQGINPAHLNPQLPVRLGPKVQVVGELVELFQKIGRKVEVERF